MALIDTDNLSYVAKNYENEVKETARRIYAQDTVNNTIARVNEKLDKLLTSINAKYDFTSLIVSQTHVNNLLEEFIYFSIFCIRS